MATIDVFNYQLNYKYINKQHDSSKPLILFLHEALGSITQWKNFPEKLCSALDMEGLIYERRGYGKSSPLNEVRKPDYLHQYALEELPEFLKSIHETRKLILFGHSDGGSISLLYSAKHSDNVIAQIVLAAHVFVEDITIKGIRPAKEIFEGTTFKEKLRRHHQANTESIFYAWYNTWLTSEFRTWNIENEIQKISSPTLIIQGKNDQYGTEKQVDSIYSNIKGVKKKVIITHCGHAPHLEAEATTIKSVVNFIQ